MLNDTQIAELKKPLSASLVSQKQGNDYIPSTYIYDQLNRIYGFCNWSSEIMHEEIVSSTPTTLKNGKEGIRVLARARVKITIHATGAIYEDSSFGDSTQPLYNEGQAYDTALKGAISLANTRATRKMGLQFGNVLYQGKIGYYDVQNEEPQPQENQEPNIEPLNQFFTEYIKSGKDKEAILGFLKGQLPSSEYATANGGESLFRIHPTDKAIAIQIMQKLQNRKGRK